MVIIDGNEGQISQTDNAIRWSTLLIDGVYDCFADVVSREAHCHDESRVDGCLPQLGS